MGYRFSENREAITGDCGAECLAMRGAGKSGTLGPEVLPLAIEGQVL